MSKKSISSEVDNLASQIDELENEIDHLKMEMEDILKDHPRLKKRYEQYVYLD